MKRISVSRVPRKWREVDRIFTEQMPFEKRRIALTAITFLGRAIANSTYCDEEGNPCLLIIMAEAVQGASIVHSEKAIAKILDVSVAKVIEAIHVWDWSPEDERAQFLERMRNYLASIEPCADPVPVFRVRAY